MTRSGLNVAVRVLWPVTGPKSGITSNTIILGWNVSGVPSSGDWSLACGDIWKFFNGTSGGAGTITGYMGQQMYRATNSVLMDVYNLDVNDPRHYFGSPVFTVSKTPGNAGGGTPFPNECAMVLSYRAGYGSDPEHDGITRPRAQDRGRMYIGPLNSSCSFANTAPNGTQYPVIAPATITAVLGAFSQLQIDLLSHNWFPAVWSRHDQALKPIQAKAMENTFDTQRRREVEPAGLLTWLPM